MVTTCGHVYHDKCLRRWLARKGTCPVCRHCLRRDARRRQPVIQSNIVPKDMFDVPRFGPVVEVEEERDEDFLSYIDYP